MTPKKIWTLLFALTVAASVISLAWGLDLIKRYRENNYGYSIDENVRFGYRNWKMEYCEACHTIGNSGTTVGPAINSLTYSKYGPEGLDTFFLKSAGHKEAYEKKDYLKSLIKWYSEMEEP